MQKLIFILLSIIFISTFGLAEFKCPKSSSGCQSLTGNRYVKLDTREFKDSDSYSDVTTFIASTGCFHNSKLVSGGCKKVTERTRRVATSHVKLATSYPEVFLHNGFENGMWSCKYKKDSRLDETVATIRAYAICEHLE